MKSSALAESKPEKMNCIVCNAEVTRRGTAQTCSELCRKLAKRAKRRRREKNRNAAHKHRRYLRQLARAREKRLPTKLANRQAREERDRRLAAERKRQRETPRECHACGTLFVAHHSQQIYCSSLCRRKKDAASYLWIERLDPDHRRYRWRLQYYSKQHNPSSRARRAEREAQYKAKQRGIIQHCMSSA